MVACYVSSSLQVLLFSPFLLNVTNRADLKFFNDGEQTMGYNDAKHRPMTG